MLVADPATQNNVLHLLAYMRDFDIRTAFLLHGAHTGLKIVTNDDDETAFNVRTYVYTYVHSVVEFQF